MLLLIGMILHFNYHVSELFYGVDLVKPGADGKVPASAAIIKTLFYHLPMIFIVAHLYLAQRWFRLTMFILSVLYSIAHAFHLAGEFGKPSLDLAQVPLLSLVLLFSLLLNKASWSYYQFKMPPIPAKG